MRFRPVRSVLLAAVALSWGACQDTPPQESAPAFEPSLAALGPSGKACDTKGLPVKDYFLSRPDVSLVKEQLRDLTAACKDGLGDIALQSGFAILTGVESARNNGNTGSPSDGAQIVVGVWNVMNWGDGAFFACGVSCTIPVLDVELIERSLDADGGFEDLRGTTRWSRRVTLSGASNPIQRARVRFVNGATSCHSLMAHRRVHLSSAI